MKRFVLMIAMLALSGAAFAGSGGEPNNTGCNGVGNVNSPCTGGTGGGGGNGGGGGGGGGNAVVDVANTNTNTNTNVQGQMQGQIQGQVQGQQQNASAVISIGNGGSLVPNSQATPTSDGSATSLSVNGNATAPFSNANYVENNSQVGDVSATSGDVNSTNTNNNTATGGQGGSGGAGGNAVSAAVVESGAVTVAEGAVQSNYTYKEVKQAPAIGQGSFAIYGCNVGGNAGASGPGWAGFLGFGWTPEQCYDFMLAQAYQSIGEKKAVCDILKNSKAGKRQEKRGITLPECLPEAPAVVPVPVPVDLTPYATKEELNRAFKKSMEK